MTNNTYEKFKRDVFELVSQNVVFNHVSVDRLRMLFEETTLIKFLTGNDLLLKEAILQKGLLFWTLKTTDEFKNSLRQKPETLDELLITYPNGARSLPEIDWGESVGQEVAW